MKKLIIILTIFGICNSIYGQYSAKITVGKSYADLDVKISDDVYMEDLGVEISEDVYMEDFTIGFTSSKSKADVIISNSYSSDFEVNIKSSYADIDIEASDDVYMEDIGIEIKKSGYVDFLIFNDIDDLTIEKLVCALLPIINLYLDENKKLKDVPIFKAKNSKYNTSNSSNTGFITPIIESQIDGEFNGWEGETIFKLINGQIWQQSSYAYMYHYAYSPEIEIYETTNGYIMKVEDVEETIEVTPINSSQNSSNQSSVIESQIDGEFNGWEGETIFKLTNGQIWQQSSYAYMYHYAYSPEIIIYSTSSGYVMKVEGVEETIEVVQLK